MVGIAMMSLCQRDYADNNKIRDHSFILKIKCQKLMFMQCLSHFCVTYLAVSGTGMLEKQKVHFEMSSFTLHIVDGANVARQRLFQKDPDCTKQLGQSKVSYSQSILINH